MRKEWVDAIVMYAQFKRDFGLESTFVPEVIAMARELEVFVRSEEATLARILMDVSGKEISIGKQEATKEQFAAEYLFTRKGFVKFGDPGKELPFPSVKIPPQKIPALAFEVAIAAFKEGRRPGDIVPWLLSEITKVVAAHPKLPE